MDVYKQSHIPAFGNWDYPDDLPITQYFESARQDGLIRYNHGERDLYGVDNCYEDDLKKPVTTVVSRHKTKGTERGYQAHVMEQQKQGMVCEMPEPTSQHHQPYYAHPSPRAPKAVDDDLYKIPTELLHSNSKRRKMLGLFSSCLLPTCAE